MVSDVPVLIVGAGPTGLLLAGELRRRGVACRLVDAHPDQLEWDRATVIHPRSMETFEALGLADAFLAAGTKQTAARLYSDGALLGAIELGDCGSRYGFNLGLSEQVTESILTDHLRRHGGDVQRGSRLVTLRDAPDGVVATIEHDGASETVKARWVVGCDGLHSLTRELAGVELVGHDITEPWAVFDVTLAGWPEPYDVNYVYLDASPVILTALPGRRWRVYLRPRTEDSDLVAEAAATIARYQPLASLTEVTHPTRFRCHTRVATRFRSGHVLLAGDAAHVCSPAQGHGMNTGVQDAFNLAWKLALVCAGRCGPDLLDSYDAERHPVAEHVTGSGDLAEQAQTLTDPQQRRARDAVLRATLTDPASRHQEAIAEAELDIDYAGSPIVAGAAVDGLWPGQRLPDAIPVRPETHHVAVLLADPSTPADTLTRLQAEIGSAADPALVESTRVLDGSIATGLAIDRPTLLAVRPDGHIGLIATDDHVAALVAYQAGLIAGGG